MVVLLLFIRKTKKIVIAKKIKKDDKIRFIDQLTLLKNRSYLSENIKKWGNNNIYICIHFISIKYFTNIIKIPYFISRTYNNT